MKSDFPKQVVLYVEDWYLRRAEPEHESPDDFGDGEKVGIYKLESVMVVRKEARFEPVAAKPAKQKAKAKR